MSAALSALIVGGVAVGVGYVIPSALQNPSTIYNSTLAWVVVSRPFLWKALIPAIGVAALVGGFFGLLAGIIAGLVVYAILAYVTNPAKGQA